MDVSSSSSLNVNGKRPLEPISHISNNGAQAAAGSGASVGSVELTATPVISTDAAAGSMLPTLQRTDKNGEPLSEKKLRRLEKNRLSARECRRRKREATENLEREINLMEGENLRLRLQLQVSV